MWKKKPFIPEPMYIIYIYIYYKDIRLGLKMWCKNALSTKKICFIEGKRYI